jgi:hypothetical protein
MKPNYLRYTRPVPPASETRRAANALLGDAAARPDPVAFVLAVGADVLRRLPKAEDITQTFEQPR